MGGEALDEGFLGGGVAALDEAADELESALEGLLELDVAIKGSDSQSVSEGQVRLGLSLWIADHVARRSTAQR